VTYTKKHATPDQSHKTSISVAVAHLRDFLMPVCTYYFRVIPQIATL